MRGSKELNAQLYRNQNEISKSITKNHSAPCGNSCSSFHRDLSSYSSYENHPCSNLRYNHFLPTTFHLAELKAKKLEVTLQRIQEQLQLNLLKQALIIKQQKFSRTNSHGKQLIDQWKYHCLCDADDDLQDFFCKESQSRLIKRESDIYDEGRGDSSYSENDCNFLKVIDGVHHAKFSNIKTVVKKINATDEEKNLGNDLLKLTATPSLNVGELDLNNYSSMCCQNSAERNSYLRCRKSLGHLHHGLKNIPVKNECVKNSNSANYITSDDKFSAMQLQQQLGIQQQELIQQLQLVQRQYLMHQEILTQEAQHPPALMFPHYVRTPLQPFEYRSKDNHGLSSTVLLKGNAGDLVFSQDLSKQDQTDQQSDDTEVTLNNCNGLELQETTAEARASQARTKYKSQYSPFSPSSKDTLNGANADETNVEPRLMHSEYSKVENMKEPSKNNVAGVRCLYSNEQSEDQCHSQNLVCSPVASLVKTNAPTTEGGNHFQPLKEKCEEVSRNEIEISPGPHNAMNESLNETVSFDQQSSIGVNFAEIVTAEKQFHHLFAHGMCRWPGCELILDDVSAFMKFFSSWRGIGEELQSVLR